MTGPGQAWAQKTWDLSSLAGTTGKVRFRYATDGGLHYAGPFVDELVDPGRYRVRCKYAGGTLIEPGGARDWVRVPGHGPLAKSN